MNRILSPFRALLDLWKHPTPAAIAKRQLEDAEREILRHLDAAEFHDAMVAYLETKIRRLKGDDIQLRLAQIDPADLLGMPTIRKAA